MIGSHFLTYGPIQSRMCYNKAFPVSEIITELFIRMLNINLYTKYWMSDPDEYYFEPYASIKLIPYFEAFINDQYFEGVKNKNSQWQLNCEPIIFTDSVPVNQIYLITSPSKNKKDSSLIVGNLPPDIDRYASMKAFL